MYYISGKDPKWQFDFMKVLQSINTNDYATLKRIFDVLVKQYGVIPTDGCNIGDRLRVKTGNNNDLIIQPGSAIFPIFPGFFLDYQDTSNITREIIVSVKLDSHMTISKPDYSCYIVITVKPNYFNEIIARKVYQKPMLEENAIYSLEPDIALVDIDDNNYTYNNNTGIIKKKFLDNNYYSYGLVLARYTSSDLPQET